MGFPLRIFSAVFKIRDSAGQPYVLIGGQAVNYWAERYVAAEPELKKLQPFTSEDIDFQGTRDDVQRIASQLSSTAVYPPKVAMTALSGQIPFHMGDLSSIIEVVRTIPGISVTARTPAIQAAWDGNVIRVLDPISLLASKLELAATIPQQQRRDVVHLKILVPCVRSFLGELLDQVEAGQLAARDWLKVANEALKLTATVRARKIGAKHQINWRQILPLSAISKCRDDKIRKFREQQLVRDTKRSKGVSM